MNQNDFLYDEASVNQNLKIMSQHRSLMAGVSGAAAGVLGLTGISGFVFYLMIALFSSFLFLGKAGFAPAQYFRSSARLFDGIFGVLDSYVLFWTLFYALVYIY